MPSDFPMELDALSSDAGSKSVAPKRMSDFEDFLRQQELEKAARATAAMDHDYERQEGVRDVLSAVRDGSPLVFVSGRAGTGKSRLIDYMKSLPDGRQQVVVAPTGISAMALRAPTIHAFFKLPIGVVNAELLNEETQLGNAARRMTRLVIDEISMVRADVLDGIDARLRQLRGDDRPFGNVQVVMVGDFLQLPPVVTEEDRELLKRLGYATPFAFSSRVMQATPIRVATLKKVWRQSDPDMIAALGAIREGRNISSALDWLNTRCAKPHRPGVTPLLLTATRASADSYNAEGLQRLVQAGAKPTRFAAEAGGAFEHEHAILPAPRDLDLVVGLRVMSVKNDPAGAFVNGSLGFVTAIHPASAPGDEPSVEVLFDGADRSMRITPSDWTKTRQVWDETEEAIVEETTGFYRQLPLTIGFAMTIHKSQGLTLEDVRIDLGRGAFAPGQLYVALSRAKSIEGLSLVRSIEPRDVQVDDMLVQFLRWARSADNLDFTSGEGGA